MMNFVFEVLSHLRDTDYRKYLKLLNELEVKLTDSGDADALSFVQFLKAAEQNGDFSL